MSDQDKFTEDAYEQTLIALFRDELGYKYECGYEVERNYKEPFYRADLEASMRLLNPDLPAAALDDGIKKLTTINEGTLEQNNEKFTKWMQDGLEVSYQQDGEERTVLMQLISFEQPERNFFKVVNQWTIEEYKKKRCDMVVMVNGLPLVVVELKSATAEDATIDDAYKQIKNYQQSIPSLFSYNAFNVISDMSETRAGTITAKQERYMEWKTVDGENVSTLMADYRTFFIGMFQQERLLDILNNYICFEHKDGKTSKILAAYHQYFAVGKAMARTKTAVEGNGKIGVFWHTQGSGKSFSMVFYAHQLVQRLPEVTIVVVTDRKDLDDQLFGQFSRCMDFLRQEPIKATSRQELGEILRDRKSGGLIFTTIQKFEEGDTALSTRRNIIVMTDEAHRSQYGDEHWDAQSQTMKKGFSQKMREALPNASFIGFTGTPISERDRDTEEVFGSYIDVYDMSQAVDDGATRPIYYESRVVNLNLDEKTMKLLDEEFDRLSDDGATDEQIKRAKQEHSRLEVLLGEDATIDTLVRDIIDHYEQNRAQLLTGKAMVVALTREIAIKIYRKMLELRPSWTEKVKVVMSGSNQDPDDWQKIIGNEAYKKELAAKFKKDDDPMKIAIVRDMWLTGFDVPSLATMYVYKPMSGHNLMQAIARVNRVFEANDGEKKEGGLIVDYVGIAQALKAAMKQYTNRDQRRFGDPDITKTALQKWKEEIEICRDMLHGFSYTAFFEPDNTKRALAITGGANFLSSPAKDQAKKNFMEHSAMLHNATTLCRSLLSEKQKAEVCYMDALRVMMLKLSQKGKVSRHEINERIGELLRQSVKTDGVINLFGDRKVEFSLFDEAFIQEIKNMKERNLAVELLTKLMKEKIKQQQKTNVIQSDLFSDMLNKSLSNYLKGLLTNEEVISELLKMAQQIKHSEEEGDKLGLTPEEKAFYDALSTPEGVRQAYSDEEFVALTKELTEVLHRNRTIDWNRKESARAKMRVMVKRLLKKYKYPPEGAQAALETVMRQCDHWADEDENVA
ncbi:type I restriction endonuclease subunit R [Prevotella stercorea]|uniref:type I restriction endonuclease subunit R n=1 Tax=Leyella stercorea TaxID=363265 RepID=UPI001F362B0F|nr:type I restriction endonuclease subunit R [Leyella stercorea]MCF2646252.1 type I restriction endonuclease subunit R [Leyella stercorea]